jgi:hypothetical protein
LSTQTDASHQSHPIPLDSQLDLPTLPDMNDDDREKDRTEKENDKTLELTELSLSDATPENQSDSSISQLNEKNIMVRRERSQTGSSSLSLSSKQSLPNTHKYVMAIVDQYIFCQSEENPKNEPLPVEAMEEICSQGFQDCYGMDMFLQVLDEKRGRSAELDELGFRNMKIAMKVSPFFILFL